MKAIVVRHFGGPDVLELADVPEPEPGPGQVKIRVRAAAVNPVDVATRAGWLADNGLMVATEHVGIGWDVSGVVEEVGRDEDRFLPGDRVIGLRDRLNAPLGTHAERVVLDGDAVAHTPAGLSDAAASTLPLNGLTAAQALDVLDLDRGNWLLVTGAGGGVGGLAVQLARLRGLRTIGIGRRGHEERARQLGIDEFLAASDDLGNIVRGRVPRGVDGVLDAAGMGVRALDALRNGGSFVALSAGTAPPPLRATRVRNVWISADGTQLGQLAELAGKLTLPVAATYPLEHARTAHERVQAGGLSGRVVLITT